MLTFITFLFLNFISPELESVQTELLVFPTQLITFALPSLIYFVVYVFGKKQLSIKEVLQRLGFQFGHWSYYLWALLLLVPVATLSYLVAHYLLPPGILKDPRLNNQFAKLSLSISSVILAFLYNAVYVAFGEEMFFRGCLAGVLGRRLSLVSANIVQALIFVVPHLVILTVFPAIWPLVTFVPLLYGLIYGWLRLRSGSFFPAYLLHTLTNTLAAVEVMK